MTRLKAAFCDGLFSLASKEEAKLIMDESSRICGDSPEVMSEVVQTKFFLYILLSIGSSSVTILRPVFRCYILEQLLGGAAVRGAICS
jgi:hypothetical protein